MHLSKFLDPKNDVAFRKIFGSEEHKEILICFIDDILELKDNNLIEDLEFLSTTQDPEIASKKQSIVDVLCKDKNGVQIIVEMQVAPTRGFEKRAQYYAAKTYSRQLNKGQEEDGKYENLKEVIFIAIADYIVFPSKKGHKSKHVMLDRKTYEHDLRDFSFLFIELPKFNKKKIEELESMTDKWCFFFKEAKNTSEADMERIAKEHSTIGSAYEVVNQFNWSEKQLIAYEQEKKRIWDNIAAMNYQMDRVREEGREEEKIKIATNLLASNLSEEVISRATGLILKEIEKLKQ